MPATLTYPGVYIEEIPSGVHTITGVATSIAAFVGAAFRGPTDDDPLCPITINGFADFERIFGGLWTGSAMGYAVRDFFLNGGSQALIVRVFETDDAAGAKPARTSITAGDLTLEAAYPGSWGRNLRVSVDPNVSEVAAQKLSLTTDQLFNLTIRDVSPNGRTEQFNNLTAEDRVQRIDSVLKAQSKLMRWKGDWAKPNLTKLKAARDAAKTLADKQKDLAADPNDAAKKTAVEDAQKAYDDATQALSDAVSGAEQKLAAAQKNNAPNSQAVTDAQNNVKSALDNVATSDGKALNANSFVGPGKEDAKAGLYALRKADLFNILCIPPYTDDHNVDASLIAEAAAYCEERRAMLLVDPPSGWGDKDAAKAGVGNVGTNSKNAALFFPRLRMPNPLEDNHLGDFVPCGSVAGIFARTDTNRGVWKAPAGLEATLVGVPGLSVQLTDAENGELNPLGVNCLRAMPAAGRVVWGARTLQGDDRLASEWKYIPIRRTALFIEESLYRGTQWVVFEPNDEPLWAQIRLNVGAFMNSLFRQGAFQGTTPRDAYFVKCDKDTNPQNDIDRGIVNIVVGFAPLKPAEFVVIKLQQIAGQIQT
jgi:Bacteriophage tail sheath protein